MADEIILTVVENSEITLTIESGITTLTSLTDTPGNYSGQAGKTVSVNDTETGVEFSDAGSGDMAKATYDPTLVEGDAFDMDNMAEGTTNKILTATDKTNLDANTVHRTSDGTDHSNVVLNDTHRSSDGTDHANVVLNDAHRISDGKDHSDVVLNNTHRTSDGSDHTFIDQDVTTTASPNFLEVSTDGVKFDITTPPTLTPEGTVWWNGDEHTINVETGLGPTIQVGQEVLLLYFNDTGSIITNLSVLHPKSATLVGSIVVPTPDLADASDWELCQGTLAIATQDIGIGELGFAVRFGKARGGDTSAFAAGAQLWLSATTPGAITDVKPQFPDFSISLGGTLNSAISPNGEIFTTITGSVEDTFNDAWDGSIRETISFTVTSDGATITGALENGGDNTRDLTLKFSDGFYTLDTTPAITLPLTAGTDTNPQTNYVFIDQATKTLQISTSDWPGSTEHIKVAYIVLRSATATQTDGALVNQNWNDHIKKEDDNGHILHITERIRQDAAKYSSGVDLTTTIVGASDPDDVFVSTTEGVVYQLHRQTFPAQDMQTGDHIHIVNNFTTPYIETTNLNTQTSDSAGNTLSNRSFSFVVWGVNNKSGEPSHLMMNLPTNSYVSSTGAINDASNYSVYTIPKAFQGTGFLIARLTFTLSAAAGGTWTLEDTQDLRGFTPNVAAGGSGGGTGATTFTGLTDTPAAYSGQANKVVVVNGAETALEFAAVGSGDVVGPASAVDSNIVLFDGVSGKLIKDSALAATALFNKSTDDTDDITVGATNKFTTAADITRLANTSGTNTGDQVAGDFDHENLLNVDSGTYRHLSLTDKTDLTDAGDSALHFHSTDRDRANHSGTQLASTISDFQITVSLNVDVSASKTITDFINVTQAVDLDVIESDTGLNNTHRSSDGTDHANVVLNDAHRISDGKDHSDVVLNNTHRTSTGIDHTYINQDVSTTASPTYVALTLSSVLSGATNIDYTGQSASPIFTLSDGASITPDWNNGNIQTVTLAGNRTLANPTNQKSGARYMIIVNQDATGTRTLTFGTAYKFSGGTIPTLTTTASAKDVLVFVSDGTNLIAESGLDYK